MTGVKVVRDTYAIASEINIIKAQTNKIVLSASVEIGKRLLEAKEMVGHGSWGQWLKDEVNYSERTAQRLMKIHEEYADKLLDNSNPSTLSDLGFSQAIALLQVDSEERENFIEEHDPNQMTVKEFEEAVREKTALEKEKVELVKKLNELENKDSQHAEVLKEKIRVITEYEEMIKEKNQDIRELKALVEQNESSEEADTEAVNQFQGEIKAKKAEIRELKKKLKEKPTEVEVEVEKVVEVVPEGLQAEMDALKEQLTSTAQKLHSSESASKFKANFEVLKNVVSNMLNILNEMKAENPEEHEKYKTAFNNMLDKLRVE